MQEERVKRQMERTQSLGAGVAREAAKHPSIPAVDLKPKPSAGSWLESASSNLASSWVATLGGPSLRPEATSTVPTTVPIEELDDGDDELELTESQIMQFEDENAAILRNVQDTLASVQLAESRLMEISSLQTELIAHLSHQTELTDQLYDDAIASTATMEKGNEQLEEAKRRGKDSRLFILMFLIAASLSLLFLHYY
jgi:syntaxin 18